MLNQSKIGLVRPSGFDQFHHRRGWIDGGFFETATDDGSFVWWYRLRLGEWSKEVVANSSQVTQRFRSRQHDGNVATILLNDSIVADFVASRRVDLDWVSIGCHHGVAVGGGELTQRIEDESSGACEELFVASLDHKKALFVVDGEVRFVSGCFDGAVLEHRLGRCDFGTAANIGQRTRMR